MKRHKPKQYQYRMKRGFLLWPKWEEFKTINDCVALEWVSRYIEQNPNPFRYRKVKVQKLVDGKWVNI